MPSMFRSPLEVTSSIEESSENSHVTPTAPPTTAGSTVPGLELPQDGKDDLADKSNILTRATSFVAGGHVPNLKPHQHASLLQMALIEQNCRNQALKVLNEGRGEHDRLSDNDEAVIALAERIFADMSRVFEQTADLPPEFVGPEGKHIRNSYLSNFDTILHNAALNVSRGIEPFSNSSEEDGRGGPSAGRARRGSRALATIGMGQITDALDDIISSSAPSLMLGQNNKSFITRSRYINEYEELALLGKGGYGQVWKVRNHLDNQEYAVKKIVITSHKLHKSRENEQIEALLAELRTLARLFHTNIVRYHHGWIESSLDRPASVPVRSNSQNLLGAASSCTTTSDETSLSDDAIPEDDDLNMSMENVMNPNAQLRHEEAIEETDDYGIVFGEPSTSQSPGISTQERRPSQATTTSAFTQKASLRSLGENEDDDVETVPRNSPSHQPSANPSVTKGHAHYDGPDIILYIQMSLHPTTLSNYLSPDPPNAEDPVKLRHCYHQDATIAILSAILDGIEYLHSQRIVHRDLKPANIFLSVHTDNPPSPNGCVLINACSECAHAFNSTPIYITPCIGDFGLIAEMQDPTPNPADASFRPSQLAHLSPRPVGTQFYRPAQQPAHEPRICPKLDVYSLGVIAFELLWKFDTRTERVMLLTQLARGVLPDSFVARYPVAAAGIRAMVQQDRDRRWDCAAVRAWLTELRGK